MTDEKYIPTEEDIVEAIRLARQARYYAEKGQRLINKSKSIGTKIIYLLQNGPSSGRPDPEEDILLSDEELKATLERGDLSEDVKREIFDSQTQLQNIEVMEPLFEDETEKSELPEEIQNAISNQG